jgi:hypothetical protein
MSAYTIVTAQERGRFDALRKSMVRADGPAILDRRRIDGYDGQQVTYLPFPQKRTGGTRDGRCLHLGLRQSRAIVRPQGVMV